MVTPNSPVATVDQAASIVEQGRLAVEAVGQKPTGMVEKDPQQGIHVDVSTH